MGREPLYRCEFPGCKQASDDKTVFDRHHIIPRGKPGSSNKPNNILCLCPSHHRLIFVPGETKGIHSISHAESIIIVRKLQASNGPALEFVKCSDEKGYYYFYKDGDVWSRDT